MKATRAKTVIFLLSFFLLLWGSPSRGETTLEGDITTGLSLASSDCEVVQGSIVCSDEPKEDGTIPYFFEQLVDMKVTGLFGPGDEVRSISEFYHPYTPFSGLTFQGFTTETLVGEIASVRSEMVFSPNIILYTFSDKRTESYGANFPGLAFRRLKSTVEFGLVGLSAATTLILDNWRDEPEDPHDIRSGLIFELTGEMENEVELGIEARLGVKGGVTCFGNCLGPLKLQQGAVQAEAGFEEVLISADDFSVKEVEFDLSSKFSADNGFDSFTLSGSRTWEYMESDITLASSLVVTSNAFLPFTGTSFTWSADPLILSIYFDETYQLSNATQTIQFNPDLSELNVEGLNLSSQALLANQINFTLTIPTDPVDFTTAFRFTYEDGRYDIYSSLYRARLSQSPFSGDFILAFRENSRILKLEVGLEF